MRTFLLKKGTVNYNLTYIIRNIPVTITATLSEPFYFNVQDGDMAVSSNWTYNGSNTHGLLPDKRFPIIVSQAMTINEGELVAYGVTIEEGGSVNIQPTGGLTLHAGGFTRVDENNLVIHSNTAGRRNKISI